MSLDNLPVEWFETTLDQIAEWGSGGTPSRKNSTYYGGDVPWIKTGDLGEKYVTQATEFITDEAVKNSSAKYFKKGSVIMAMYGATIGKTSILGIDATTNQACAVGTPIATSTEFLYYFLRNEKDTFIAKGKGGAQPNISQQIIKAHTVYLPTLAEQQEIVRQLDVMLAQVEQIKARLDAIPAILKKFRQSVLADAVSGKLTEAWRNSNEKNSAQNFEKYISDYRIQKYLEWEKESLLRKGKKIPSDEVLLKKYKPTLSEEITRENLPDGWSRQLLDGLIYISARIGWKGLKAEEYTQEGPLFLSVHGLNYGKVVRLDQAFHISQERYDESPEIALKNDDILLCKDGAGIGKVGIVKGLDEPASINSSLLLIRSGEIFVPEFLYYVFKGPYIQKLVQERLTGTAIPHLFQRDIKEFLLDLPPLDEQKLIVETVEAYFDWVEKIEKTVQSAQKRVNLLTQSILAKAFRGELTAEWRTQHQDLISGVNSAESLLAKIQAEREASKSVKETRAKKEV